MKMQCNLNLLCCLAIPIAAAVRSSDIRSPSPDPFNSSPSFPHCSVELAGIDGVLQKQLTHTICTELDSFESRLQLNVRMAADCGDPSSG